MRTKNLFAAVALAAAMALLTMLVVGGCSSSTKSDSSVSLQVSSVTASPSAIAVGSTTIIEAEVTDGDKVLANRAVTFTVNPTNAGYFTPAVDTTDASGVVGTVFTATQSGAAILTASVSSSISNSVTITISSSGGSGSGNISMSVSPSMLLANGTSTSEVTITVRDASAELAPDSTIIKLTAGEKFVDVDGNGYFTSGVDSVVYDAISNDNWDPVGIIPSTAIVTGGAGQATVNYVSGTDAVTVYIKATVNDNGITGDAETSIQLTSNTSISSITLMAADIHLAVKTTGGIENSTLYATGYDANGNRVPEGLQISFIITDGPGGGEHLGSVGYGPYVASTNSLGTASCPISSGTVSGSVRIRAYCDTVLSNATQIMVHAGPPAVIIVGTENCNVQDWGWINKRVGVTALVSDIYHNPVADSTVVYFTCDEGTVLAHLSRTENEEGIAGSTWISGYDTTGGADGIVEIYAETNGGTLKDTGYFINSWLPDTLWYVGFPSSIPADGKSKATFYIQVRDCNRNFVIDQTKIDIDANYLDVSCGLAEDGCNGSAAKASITSVILDYDYSMNGTSDDGIGAVDYITGSYKGIAGTGGSCTMTTGFAYYSACILNVEQTINYGTSVPFSVTIKDRSGNLLGDHTLVASVSGGGSISYGTQQTDAYGEASGFLFNAPSDTTIASVVIRVQDIDARGGVTLSKSITLSE